MPPALIAVFLFVVAGLVAFPEDAAACSCAGGVDPRVVLREADAAFVGTVIERRESHRDPDDAVWSSGDPVTLVFRVEESVKGDLGTLVEVETSFSGASCGIEPPVGERLGLFLYALDSGGWTSGLCSEIEPAALLEAAGPNPAPTGSGQLGEIHFYSALASLFGFICPLCALGLVIALR
jgi:hypothetical protein